MAIKMTKAPVKEITPKVSGEQAAARIRKGLEAISASLIDREVEVRLMGVALVTGEHVLLVGPPGTGKSLLCGQLAAWLGNVRFWQRQFTKFTEPGEVIGPINLAALKAGSQERIPTGMLPEAEVAFLDEIFKANSAILNSLLLILNERQCDIGGALRIACPLRFAMGASNEWPTEREELGALFDRFLFRKTVTPIRSRAGLDRLLTDPTVGRLPDPCRTLRGDLEQAAKEVAALPWATEAHEAFHEIVQSLRREGIEPGDRRLRKSYQACRADAWLNGQRQVQPRNLEILAHSLWVIPGEQQIKTGEVVTAIANPTAAAVNAAIVEATEILAGVDRRNMAAVASALAKLREVGQTRLAPHKGTPEGDKARTWLWAEIHNLQVESVGGMTDSQF
jgi:MoxR-like ATPase